MAEFGTCQFVARLAGGDGRRVRLIVLGLEVFGALAITGFGLVLLGGALYGPVVPPRTRLSNSTGSPCGVSCAA